MSPEESDGSSSVDDSSLWTEEFDEELESISLEATDLIPYSAPAELEELGLDPHYAIDTFSSDYDEFIDDMGEC